MDPLPASSTPHVRAREAGTTKGNDDMEIIRITAHPTDPNIVSVHAGPSLANTMGRFEPARWDRDGKTYLIHVDVLDAFSRYCHVVGIYLVDERGLTRGQTKTSALCDICNRNQRDCQLAVMNSDHLFTPKTHARGARS